MKVSKKTIDSLDIQLTLDIAAADYAEIERKKLAERRRTADFKGFRKGNVPASLIQRVYGEQCLADAVNEVISEQLDKYIRDHKLNILGEPLSSAKQPEIEWKSGNDFKFIFDVALSPEVSVEIVKEDTVQKYKIDIPAEDKEEAKANLTKYYTEQKIEKTEEEIEKEVTERLDANFKQEAEWRLTKDIRSYFITKSGVQLPEDFLKRWLFVANGGKISKEDIEKDFAGFVEDFKWQLVRGTIMKNNDIKVTADDIKAAAKDYVTYQYAMYGMSEIPAEIIGQSVENFLADEKQVSRLEEQVEDNKVLELIKKTITVKSKKISAAKFRELK